MSYYSFDPDNSGTFMLPYNCLSAIKALLTNNFKQLNVKTEVLTVAPSSAVVLLSWVLKLSWMFLLEKSVSFTLRVLLNLGPLCHSLTWKWLFTPLYHHASAECCCQSYLHILVRYLSICLNCFISTLLAELSGPPTRVCASFQAQNYEAPKWSQ